MFVISLSAVPPRFGKFGVTLDTLLRQTAPIDKILLYIPHSYKRFPDWDGTLPEVPEGVEIRRCADYGPATKVLGAVKEFQGQDVDILFGDDDWYYRRDWAAKFLAAKKRHPSCAIAMRGMEAATVSDASTTRALQPRAQRRWRITDMEFQLLYLLRQLRHGKDVLEPGRRVFRRSGYVDIFEGCCGVMVRPEMFDEVAFDIPEVAFSVDDMWLSGMLARKNVPIWLRANTREPEQTEAELEAPLVRSVVGGMNREQANRATVKYLRETYGIWP